MGSEREIVKKLNEKFIPDDSILKYAADSFKEPDDTTLDESGFDDGGSHYTSAFGRYSRDGNPITRDDYIKARDAAAGIAGSSSTSSKGEDPKSWKDTDKISYDDAKKLAKSYYKEGGADFLETWEDYQYKDYEKQFGPMRVKDMKALFGLYKSDDAEHEGNAEVDKNPEDAKPSKKSYEDYTPEDFDDELDSIESEVSDYQDQLRDTDYDNRDDLYDNLDNVSKKISDMEEYLSDDQYKKSEDILSSIARSEDIDYDGPTKRVDPYTERGLNRSDFY